jgi:phosphatidate cytidylyltransferase
MLAQRVLTALVGIPVILGLIVVGDTLFSVAVGLVLALAVLEFWSAADPEKALPSARPRIQRTPRNLLQQRPPAYLAAAATGLLVAGAHHGRDEWMGALALALALSFLFVILRDDTTSGLRDWTWTMAGVVYIGFLGSHLVRLRALDGDGDWVILAVFSTFAADTAAYFAGRAVGRVHIAPAISPGKTLEGSVAGLVGGFAAVLFLNWITGLRTAINAILPLAVLLPSAAIVGDLAESLIKRGGGVKDASGLVPGHGGVLDRLDSVLFTTPLVYYWVIWVVF